MAALATVSDLEGLLGQTLDDAGRSRAAAVLDRVSSLVRSEGLAWADIPSVPESVVTVVLDIAHRVFLNPQNFRQVTSGPFAGSYSFVGLHLTGAERRIVRRAAGRRSGLQVISTTRDDFGDGTVWIPTGPEPSGQPFPWYAEDDPTAGL